MSEAKHPLRHIVVSPAGRYAVPQGVLQRKLAMELEQVASDGQTSHHDGYHAHQLDQDVQ